MVSDNIEVDDKIYKTESWVNLVFDTKQYVVGLQVWGPGAKDLANIECSLSREFVEDEIDNELREEYLEKTVSRMAAMHIQEIIDDKGKLPHTKIRHWLKEAKRELDHEK